MKALLAIWPHKTSFPGLGNCNKFTPFPHPHYGLLSAPSPTPHLEYHTHILSFSLLTGSRSRPLAAPAETTVAEWGTNWPVHASPATAPVTPETPTFPLLPGPHPQGQPSVHSHAHLCFAEPFRTVLVLNRPGPTQQFRSKTQGGIRQFIKPSHSQKYRNWCLQTMKKLPSGTSFFRFFFQYSSESEVVGRGRGWWQAPEKQWKRQMVLLFLTKSVKLNAYISQVTFPHLQVSREKETQTSLFVSYFRFYILAISYDACLSLSGLLHLVWKSLGLSMLLQMVLTHYFYSWVIFHSIYVPHLLYTFIYWWILRLLPYFGYYK